MRKFGKKFSGNYFPENKHGLNLSCCCSSEAGIWDLFFVINDKRYSMEQRRRHFQASK
jgi:hypothetical protein